MLQQLQELMNRAGWTRRRLFLDQLRQMMENMQMAQGQQGQGQQGEGQQAMEGLAETLRQQQGLSDETFGDLQEQFGQGQQPGQTPGEGQEGQQDKAGRAASSPARGRAREKASRAASRNASRRSVTSLNASRAGFPASERPKAMRRARRSTARAARWTRRRNSLRRDDLAGALDNQSDAMEALREGMRELGEQMAQQQGQPGQQGEAMGQADAQGRRDPLGRETGQNGRIGTDQQLLQGEDVSAGPRSFWTRSAAGRATSHVRPRSATTSPPPRPV